MNPNDVFQIKSFLQNAQSVLIVLGQNADIDTIAAGLGLYLSLNKTGKQISIISPEKIKVELSFLFGVNKIENNISGSNNLIVSLPYQEGVIEKVSYNIANNKFNLVIEPRGETFNFDPKQIEYTYGSGSYDVIFILGVSQLQALGALHSQRRDLFSQKPIVNIDKNNNNNQGFGRINLLGDTSISQTIALLMKGLRLPTDEDIASNLLTGLSLVNDNLSFDQARPDSLEAAAFLLRSGGKILHGESFQIKIKNQEAAEKKEAAEDWLKPKIFTTQKKNALL